MANILLEKIHLLPEDSLGDLDIIQIIVNQLKFLDYVVDSKVINSLPGYPTFRTSTKGLSDFLWYRVLGRLESINKFMELHNAVRL